jgi:hypothetical protein
MSTEITFSSTVICSYLNIYTTYPSYWSFLLSCHSEILSVTCASPIHETEIKMAEMVEMVEIISTCTLPKVKMAEIMSYYIILIRYK